MLCDHVAILNYGRIITSSPKAELLKSAAQKDLSVQLPGGSEFAARWFGQIEPYAHETGLKIRFNPNETTAGNILAQLSRHNLMIGDVSTDEPDLEDIFLQMTTDDNWTPRMQQMQESCQRSWNQLEK